MLKRVLILSLLLITILSLSACGLVPLGPQGSSPDKDYYKGTRGVVTTFVDSQSPPSKMYYYEGDQASNTFNVMLDVHNEGASYTKGGVYVSGYDPSMIRIDGIDIPENDGRWQDCSMNFGVSNDILNPDWWNGVAAGFSCSDTGLNTFYNNDQDWGASVESLGGLFGNEDEWWSGIGFSYENEGGSNVIDIDWQLDLGVDSNLEYLNHGRALLVMLAGLSFDRYNGQEFMLRPDNYEFPGGEAAIIDFNAEITNWPQGLDKTERPMPFLVTSCYLYATYAAPQVCIDPSPEDGRVKVCRPRDITYTGGQGAPVAITKIEQENTHKTVYFTISVKNVGGGTVFDMGHIEKCSPYFPSKILERKHLNKVYLTDVRIGNVHLSCTPSRYNPIDISTGTGQIRCSYDIRYSTAQSAYETPLIMELSYGYSDVIQRSTMLKRAI